MHGFRLANWYKYYTNTMKFKSSGMIGKTNKQQQQQNFNGKKILLNESGKLLQWDILPESTLSHFLLVFKQLSFTLSYVLLLKFCQVSNVVLVSVSWISDWEWCLMKDRSIRSSTPQTHHFKLLFQRGDKLRLELFS